MVLLGLRSGTTTGTQSWGGGICVWPTATTVGSPYVDFVPRVTIGGPVVVGAGYTFNAMTLLAAIVNGPASGDRAVVIVVVGSGLAIRCNRVRWLLVPLIATAVAATA